MRALRRAGLALAAVVIGGAGGAFGGQRIDVNALPAGTRFCPAPWADNSEFMSSYFSIDAQTGQMTRHDSGSGPIGVTPEPEAREQVLFVSPPISVANVYVPPPGGPAVPPQTMATGVLRQQPRQPVRPAPQQQYAQTQPYYPPQPQQPRQQPQYAQTQPYPPQPSVQPQPYPQYRQPQQQPIARQPYQLQPYQQYPQPTPPPAAYGARIAR